MLAVKITDVKDFMSKLLIGTTFDTLLLSEASVTTFCTYTVDGTLHRNFYDSDTQEALSECGRTLTLWREVKPFFYSVIRGKQTPLRFQMVFRLSDENAGHLLKNTGLSFSPNDITGMYLNFQYNGTELTGTAGTSLRVFTLEKTLDMLWEQSVLHFLQQNGVAFERL